MFLLRSEVIFLGANEDERSFFLFSKFKKEKSANRVSLYLKRKDLMYYLPYLEISLPSRYPLFLQGEAGEEVPTRYQDTVS